LMRKNKSFDSLITVRNKKNSIVNSPDVFYNVINGMLDAVNDSNVEYKTDGLIFTPENDSYLDASIYKWKPPDKLTIDFYIVWNENMEVELYTYKTHFSDNVNKKEFFDKKETQYIIFDKYNKINYHGGISLIEKLYPTGSIIEFGYSIENEKIIVFAPTRSRNDKKGPNNDFTASNVFNDMVNPITEDDIRGKTLKFAYKYHNKIKREVFEKLNWNENNNGIILDIGIGNGGDLSKFPKTNQRVIGVEPSGINIVKLKERLIGYKNKFDLIKTGGENYQFIREELDRLLGKGEKVDVISMMLSMTFFWKDEKMFNGLVKTIKKCLKPDGVLLFLTMDGDLTSDFFDRRKKKKYTITGDNKIQLMSDENGKILGRQLNVTLPGTIVSSENTTQVEYLVFLDQLEKALGKWKISTKERVGDNLLTERAQTFVSLYTYGVFGKIDTEYEKIEEDFIDGELDGEIPRLKKLSFKIKKIIGEEKEEMKIEKKVEQSKFNKLKDDTILIDSIGDGNCLIHSILNSISKKYKSSDKRNMAKNVRKELSQLLEVESVEEYTYWETVSNNLFLAKYFQYLLIGDGEGYNISSIQNYFNSSANMYIDDVNYICDVFGINYIVVGRDSNVCYTSNVKVNREKTIIINYVQPHYDTIGVEECNMEKVLFDTSSDVVKALMKRFNFTYNDNIDRDNSDPYRNVLIETDGVMRIFLDYLLIEDDESVGGKKLNMVSKIYNTLFTFILFNRYEGVQILDVDVDGESDKAKQKRRTAKMVKIKSFIKKLYKGKYTSEMRDIIGDKDNFKDNKPLYELLELF